MIQLPEKIRRPLDKMVKNLKTQETISSIGLFGSWSRGDAEPSSDVDLLIVDNRPLEDQYIERCEQTGILIDLNYIPHEWISGSIPFDLDQKIYESYILYDRDWLLTEAKKHVMSAYYAPERLGIRTEGYIIDADIYLSRATSAQARGDHESAQIFAALSAQIILKTIIEFSKLPIKSSRYLGMLEKAAKQLDITPLFMDYLSITRLENLTKSQAEEKLNSFKAVWNEIFAFTRANTQLLNSMHFKIRTKLSYYTNCLFLQGMILQLQALLNENLAQEASHYAFITLVDMLENYAWLKAAQQKMRLDYTTLLRSLKSPEQKASVIYSNAKKALNIEGIDEEEIEKSIVTTKRLVLEIRQKRRAFLNEMRKETY